MILLVKKSSSKSKEYWADRFTTIEASVNKISESIYKNQVSAIKETQRELSLGIEKWVNRLAVNNELNIVDARELLNKSELAEFRWTLEEYIKYGEENAINQKWIKELENASARVHIQRLEALKLQSQKQLEMLAFKYENNVYNVVKNAYEETYLKGAYEIAKGTNKGVMLSGFDERKLNRVTSNVVAQDGRHFSERIWSDTAKLSSNLNQELMKNIMLGKNPKEAIKNLTELVNEELGDKKEYMAKRLIYTEASFYSSVAQKDMYLDLGVEWYEVVATLDMKTSSVCRELDGKVFPISEYQPGITANPFHPRCRSTTAPNFDKEDEELGLTGELSNGERAARGDDGKSYYVSSDISYKEWENTFVNKNINEDLKVIKQSDIIESGAISRSDYKRMDKHAELYYKEIRKRTSDIEAISRNTKFSVEEVKKIKEHIFINEYELLGGFKNFDPNYDMAVSWQRLIDGSNIKEMDIVLLNHELLEYDYMNFEKMNYVDAHKLVEQKYNYSKYLV